MAEDAQAFPKAARLLHKRDFQRVFDQPAKSGDRYLLVLARDNGQASARLGLVVSRKAARRAVDRSRLKRLIRESFRLHRGCLGGLDCVVLSRPGAAGCGNGALTAALSTHWRRLQLRLCGPS